MPLLTNQVKRYDVTLGQVTVKRLWFGFNQSWKCLTVLVSETICSADRKSGIRSPCVSNGNGDVHN